jgi:uncharacterized protein (TIGR00725 family)
MAVYVCVIGPDPCDEQVGAECEQIGRLLGRAGAVLVCGGLGGSMEAAARGAASEGGVVLGILPGLSRDEGNPYLSVAVPTGMGEMRNVLNVRASDAVIAVSGEFGTLSEIAFALKSGVPVVGLHTWDLSKASRPVNAFPMVSSPEEAVSQALRLASGRSQ